MKLVELAYYINNLNGLSCHLDKEIDNLELQMKEVNSIGQRLYDKGFDMTSNEQTEIQKKLTMIANDIKTLKEYKRSIYALINIEAQIPTKL